LSIRVLHVAHGVEKEQTGAGYVIPRLCSALVQQGIKITLIALHLGGDPIEEISKVDGLEFRRFPYMGLRKIGYSPQLRSFLKEVVNDIDIVHTHFLWSYPQSLAARMALRNRKPLVQTAHGALFPEALSKSKFAKFLWFKFIDGPALQKAECVVATSESEAKCIESRFSPKRLDVIPNAIETPNLLDKDSAVQWAHRVLENNDGKYILYLGNLNPHKNIEKLIEAWSGIQRNWPQHILVVAGPGMEKYIMKLQAHIHRLGLTERIKLFRPVYGQDKWALLNAAEVVVLPSLSENFGLVVAEALYCGTPVVASQGTPWSCLESEGFGHWVETEDSLLAKAINDVLSWSTERRKLLSSNAQQFIRTHFSWKEVAKQYIALYRDLLQ
jgi:glycosyltransferase involved in cell wall biosynthesis